MTSEHNVALDRAAEERGHRYLPMSEFERRANLVSGLSCACKVWSLRRPLSRWQEKRHA